MRRTPKAIAIGLLALSFGVGGLTGMALEEALGLDWFDFLDEDDEESGDRLLTGLELTDEQRRRAEEILEGEEERLEDYWEGRLPEIQSILSESYAQIRAILDAEQRAVFDQRVRDLGGRVPGEMRD